ncbi:MAG TPA: nucleotidyl transferase AbiEii/AbiGii toxin family protein [Candidatus Paceibacterota bacterium]|nr:nucleotidyl transferase AbiEii/AbiGii toxin family protein [Candidatus Paceibacterota bacterium]
METIDPRQLLVKVANILDRLNIPYLVTGGMAVLVWGRPRFTADIDIIIKLKTNNIDSLASALINISELGYVDKDTMREALSNHGEFNFIDGESGVKVDFWVVDQRTSGTDEFSRGIAKEILGQKINFISPEDLILSKLRWYKISPSSRHLEDIESVLKISKVDKEYLKSWVEKLDVADIWEKI